MPTLLDINRILRDECQLDSAQTIVIGVSGGPDSLALLHRMVALQREYGWKLHVAHLDHGLRGEESAAEARFVAQIAQQWNLTSTIELRDVATLAERYHVGLPTAARGARYAFLAEVAHRYSAAAVMVAHQAEDQAETILMHLVRGSGPSGLSGMNPRVEWPQWRHTAGSNATEGPALVRPLLHITRAEIESYCELHQLEPRRDPTNQSIEYTRTRMRHELFPILETYNPQVVAALSRTGRLAALESDFMQHSLDSVWPELIQPEPGAIHFAHSVWQALHPALKRLALRRAVNELRPERDSLSAQHLDLALQTIADGSAIMHQLPHNLVLHRRPHGWTLTMATTTHPGSQEEPQLTVEEMWINPAVATKLPGGDWRLSFEYCTTRPEANFTRWQALLDADKISGQLSLRQRRPGDRFRTAGAPGSRKIQDIMVDIRMPRELRNQWPLLSDENGLIWIPGLLVAERVHPTNATSHFVLLTLEDISSAS